MMDFFVRESLAVLPGPAAIIRYDFKRFRILLSSQQFVDNLSFNVM